MVSFTNSPLHIGFGGIVRHIKSLASKKLDVIVHKRHFRVSHSQSTPSKFSEVEGWSHTVLLNAKGRRTADFSALVVRRCSEKLPKKGRKESTVRKVKILFSRYWYVVIPVYLILDVSSASIFYLLLTSGFDLVRIMKLFNMDEQSIEKVEKKTKTAAGRLAIVFILLKLTAPIRYALTLALSTLAIGYLGKMGFSKEPKCLATVRKYLWESFRRNKCKK
ncbi:hypothetical protein GE061_016887 [Apolygus lucorum]|uniref:Uncharacterized protein n=1 Tax=Apolygus lucorum TaxID=248454 RepID=A0A6A4ITA7_APOLU|nr:hypothetical protein GE061_016887 [Apolygus lucorum]